jgi:ubiquinone biosynthesis protein
MRILSRLVTLMRVLVWYGILEPFFGAKRSGPIRFRMALEDLGGAWIKLGQGLALRFDVLPESYCIELFKLLNQIAPFPYSDVRSIIREDFGSEPESLFAEFEPTAFAAASIGQVHRATLHNGQKVAVKVQRPRARETLHADIKLMYLCTSVIDFTHILGGTHSHGLIDEFARWTEEELDYRIEARHGYYLQQNARGEKFEHNAGIVWQYTSARVLTSEFLEGIVLVDILNAIREDDRNAITGFIEAGVRPKRLAAHICWNLLNQVYLLGYFHADLHPANLIALRGSVVGYVDFGIVGRLSPDVRESLVHYAWSLFDRRIDRSVVELMRWVSPTELTDLESARRELTTIFEEYLTSLDTPPNRRSEGEIYRFEIRLMDAIRRHRMSISPELTMYFKAILTANAVIFELDPSFNLPRVETEFFQDVIRSRLSSWFDPGQISSTLFDASYVIQRWMGAVEPFEKFGETLGEVVGSVRGRVQKLAVTALVLAMTLLAIAGGPLADLRSAFGGWIPRVLVGLLVIVMFSIFWQSRRLPREAELPAGRQIVRRTKPE